MSRLFLLLLMSSNLHAGASDTIFKGGFEELFFVGGTTTTANVTIKLNHFDDYLITTTGNFVIPYAIENGSSYQVNIVSNLTADLCSIQNGVGVINAADITNITISCNSITTIYEVKQGNITGTVALENMLVTHCQNNYGFWVQTIVGDDNYIGDDFSGGFVFKNDIDCNSNSGDINIGDRITLDSVNINEFFGQIQLQYQSSIVLSENNQLPTPVTASVANLGGTTSIALEGVLVVTENITVTDIQIPAGPGESDPTNSFEVNNQLIVDDRLYLASPFPTIGFSYGSITGIMNYSNGKSKLLPRYQQDIVLDITNTTIYEVKQSNVTGLVSIGNLLVTHCQDNYGFWVQTIIGDNDYIGDDYSGGFVLKQDIVCSGDGAVVNIGDRIDLDYAFINTFFQQIQLKYIGSTVLSSNNGLPSPVVATAANLSGASPVPLEGVLVKVENTTVTSLDVPNNSFEVDNTLTIDDRFFIVSPFPTLNFNYSSITGVMWFSFGQSKLLPRYSQDIFEANGSATNLVINEVDYDQPQADTQEFIEIFNPTNSAISLLNKTLYLIAGPSASSHVSAQYDLSPLGTLLSGQYLVVGSDLVIADTAAGAHTIELLGSIQNGPNDGIVLMDTASNTVIDSISYEGNLDTITLLDLGVTVNVTEGSSSLVDTGDGSISRTPNGTDSNNNDNDFIFTTNITPGSYNLN